MPTCFLLVCSFMFGVSFSAGPIPLRERLVRKDPEKEVVAENPKDPKDDWLQIIKTGSLLKLDTILHFCYNETLIRI